MLQYTLFLHLFIVFFVADMLYKSNQLVVSHEDPTKTLRLEILDTTGANVSFGANALSIILFPQPPCPTECAIKN